MDRTCKHAKHTLGAGRAASWLLGTPGPCWASSLKGGVKEAYSMQSWRWGSRVRRGQDALGPPPGVATGSSRTDTPAREAREAKVLPTRMRATQPSPSASMVPGGLSSCE